MSSEKCPGGVEWFVDLKSHDETKKVAEGILESVVQKSLECFDGITRLLCLFPNHRSIVDFRRTAEVRDVPFKIYFRKDPHGVIRAL